METNMVFIEICVGSSCHLKGSSVLVEMLQKKIEEEGLENNIVLSGSFCTGKCNRVGVTISVNDQPYPGITPDNFSDFWRDRVIPQLSKE